MSTTQSSTRHEDADPWGVCSVCRKIVIYGDRFTHPCEDYHVDTSWHALTNPENTPWFPGYRFCVMQDSGAATGRKARNWRMTARRYRVYFEITELGEVRWRPGTGVKPSEATQAAVEEMYRRERPGSNWYPGCEGL